MLLWVQILIIIPFFLMSCTDEDIDVEGPQQPELSGWLSENPNIKASLNFEDSVSPSYFFNGALSEISYESWSSADKTALDLAFTRSWQWLYFSKETEILGSEEFAMPLSCPSCEAEVLTSPTDFPITEISEELAKKVYIAYVAHSLAAEIGGALSWSLLNDSASELRYHFSSRSLMQRTFAATEFFVGSPGGPGSRRGDYMGISTPATPIYAYRWFINNGLLKSTHEETIHAVLDWYRSNAIHFYGGYTYQNMVDHWGYSSHPSAYHVLAGTIRNTESTAKHWTAGCHGTAGVIKSLLKVVNIPSEVIYTCSHAQLYFPSIGRYMDHGDNPYNLNVSGSPEKAISGILIDQATHTTWFSATPDNLPTSDPLCANIGRAAQEF